MQSFLFLFNFACILLLFHHAHSFDTTDVHYMEPGETMSIRKANLQIHCYRGKPKYLIHIWHSAIFKIETKTDAYDLYYGKSPSEVEERFEQQRLSWVINFLGLISKRKEIKISPFELTCLGIDTAQPYKISLMSLKIDIWKISLLVLGISLFICSKKLSYNKVFYYICGITLGITTSVVVLMYFASKLLPKGKTMYLAAVGSWAVGIYLGQLLYENAQLMLFQYKEYVFWYIVITAIISFVVCYRLGPVTNKRTKNIIQWFLQSAGLGMIYCSSYFAEAAVGICILLVLGYNFPYSLAHKVKYYWRIKFPQRRRLLTEAEYYEQGVKETQKALNNLREYCSSPNCPQWRTMLKIKDPIRFAKFIEGSSHLADEEVLQYESETTCLMHECECTDDDDDEYQF